MSDMLPEGGFDPKDTATRLAGMISERMAGDATAPAPAELQPSDVTPPLVTPPVADDVVALEGAPAATPAAAALPTDDGGDDDLMSPEDVAEAELLLSEAGIETGTTYAEVPEALRPVYARFIQTAVDVAQVTLQQRLDAAELSEQVKEFAQRLQESPDKLLLSIALKNPEAFQQAANVYAEMQTDERVRGLVIRELQAEARLREADRKEKVNTQAGQQVKVQRVIAATRRAATAYGLPFAAAESIVAKEIKANRGEIDIATVEAVVKEHAEIMGRVGRKGVRLATPATIAAAATVPNTPAGQVGPSGTLVTPGPSKGLQFASPQARLKSIIRNAVSRSREGTQ